MSFVLTVATIWAIAVVTPGPNFLVVLRCAVAGPRAVALASVLGTILGTAIWGVAGWLGVATLFSVAPWAFTALKLAGGAYLIWLGLTLWRQAHAGTADRPLPAPPLSAAGAIRLGLLTNLANPKSAIFVASLFAAAMPADAPAALGALATAIMVALSGGWYLAVALILSHPGPRAGYRRARRGLDRLTGAVFCGFGLKLMTDAR